MMDPLMGGGQFMDPSQMQGAESMQMSPEVLALLQQIANVPEAQALLGQQASQGAGLMGTPSAQGQNVGGTYTAASPVEHLSIALQRMLGAKQQKDAMGGMQANVDKLGQARGATMADILEQMLGGAGGGMGGLKPSPY